MGVFPPLENLVDFQAFLLIMTARSDWKCLPGSARPSAQHVLVLISDKIYSQMF